jgi:hypothetical protein
MPHVEIENEIRASVDEFVEGMRALVRKAVLHTIARHLQVDVDIDAAGIAVEPSATPIQPGPKRQQARQVQAPKNQAPGGARSASRVGVSVGAVRKKAPGIRRAAPKPSTPATASSPSKRKAHPTAAASALSGVQKMSGGGASAVEPSASVAKAEPTEVSVEETAATLLAHIEIEPGQGLEELALAMDTPAADLAEPLKKLLAEGKIIQTPGQGQASYHPT